MADLYMYCKRVVDILGEQASKTFRYGLYLRNTVKGETLLSPQHRKNSIITLAVIIIVVLVLATIFSRTDSPRTASSETPSPTPKPTSSPSITPKENTLEGKPLEGFTPVSQIDTLQKLDLVAGTGDEVKAGDTITAHYTGAVAASGVVFQSSHDTGQPATFGLNQVIPGWTAGVPGMRVGGTRRLLIPAEQAYGANPPAGSNIPVNAALVFDIELVKIGG